MNDTNYATDLLPMAFHWTQGGTQYTIELTFELVGGCEPTWTLSDSREPVDTGYGDEDEALVAFHRAVDAVLDHVTTGVRA